MHKDRQELHNVQMQRLENVHFLTKGEESPVRAASWILEVSSHALVPTFQCNPRCQALDVELTVVKYNAKINVSDRFTYKH